jgi:hypothetical protein
MEGNRIRSAIADLDLKKEGIAPIEGETSASRGTRLALDKLRALIVEDTHDRFGERFAILLERELQPALLESKRHLRFTRSGGSGQAQGSEHPEKSV